MGAVQEAGMDEVMCVISSAHTTAGVPTSGSAVVVVKAEWDGEYYEQREMFVEA